MSGNVKELRRRIRSVKNTQQITKAMKRVSAAKLRRAQESITNARPYAELQAIRKILAECRAEGAQIEIAGHVLEKYAHREVVFESIHVIHTKI